MRGTVQKKGKKWYAVVYDGVDPATGNYRRRWVQAGTRRGDAEKLLADLVKRAHQGETIVSEKLTLGEYLTERWLPVQQSRLRESTFEAYRRNIALHVVPRLGKRPLDQLSPEDVDLFYATLLREGRKPKSPGEKTPAKGLAPKSVHNIHVMLNKALSDAVRKGTVIRNVVAQADPPKLSARKRNEIKAWDMDQLVTFLDAIAPHRFGAAFYLAANTGMRRGEVLGLRWQDLDLDGSRVLVRQALVSVAYKMSISDVKTGNSRRTIDIEDDVVEVMARWRDACRVELGTEPAGSDLVFLKADGTSPHPDVFSQLFDRTVAKLEVPKISLHDLRHTHATILLMALTPVKVVSERLGHANVAFTMSVYQHLLPGMQEQAAATFSRLLREERQRRLDEANAVSDGEDATDEDDSEDSIDEDLADEGVEGSTSVENGEGES